MENYARSGVRRVQAGMSFIFIFPSVVRTEKTCVVFWVLDQRTDYIHRSSKRLCLINCFDRSSKRTQDNDRIETSVSRTAPIYFTHQAVWLTTADSLTRAVGNPKAKSMQYYSAHQKTEHCKYMSRRTIAFWAMFCLSACCIRDKTENNGSLP